MLKRRLFVFVLLAALPLGCCATTAPEQVQIALANQLEDFAELEAQFLPLLPADATVNVALFTGSRGDRNARTIFKGRLRAFLHRGAGLVEWSRGKEYDADAAFQKLFPRISSTTP